MQSIFQNYSNIQPRYSHNTDNRRAFDLLPSVHESGRRERSTIHSHRRVPHRLPLRDGSHTVRVMQAVVRALLHLVDATSYHMLTSSHKLRQRGGQVLRVSEASASVEAFDPLILIMARLAVMPGEPFPLALGRVQRRMAGSPSNNYRSWNYPQFDRLQSLFNIIDTSQNQPCRITPPIGNKAIAP